MGSEYFWASGLVRYRDLCLSSIVVTDRSQNLDWAGWKQNFKRRRLFFFLLEFSSAQDLVACSFLFVLFLLLLLNVAVTVAARKCLTLRIILEL